jgi:endonuclease/exonuclease/phosphatase family metal-dependent hydrolase
MAKAPIKLNGFDKLALGFNCLLAVSLFICYLAPFVNPANFWPVAFFSMAYIPILFINLVFLVGWLFRYQWMALISGICILLGIGFIPRAIGFHTDDFPLQKASSTNIRMMTYNVYDFLNQEEDNHDNTNRQIYQILREQQPDIVNMQEYFVHNSDRGATADSIKKVLHTPYYWFRVLKITPYDSTGLAIFSKYPIINRDTIPLIKGIATEGIYVDIKVGNKMLRDYCFHLQSTQFDRGENDYLEKLSHDGKPNLHQSRNIGSKLKWAFIKRGQQVIGLKQQLAQCPYPYIIGGDFNDTPLSFVVNYMDDGLTDAFREKGSGLGITFYGQFPGFQIDHIMVSKQFNVLNYHIIKQQLSDHYPVLSDLQFR